MLFCFLLVSFFSCLTTLLFSSTSVSNEFSQFTSNENVFLSTLCLKGIFVIFSYWSDRSFLSAFNKSHVISLRFLWFLMRNPQSFRLQFPFHFLLVLSSIFFLFCFQQFNCHMSGCRFIWFYAAIALLNVFILVYIFCQIWGVFNH